MLHAGSYTEDHGGISTFTHELHRTALIIMLLISLKTIFWQNRICQEFYVCINKTLCLLGFPFNVGLIFCVLTLFDMLIL